MKQDGPICGGEAHSIWLIAQLFSLENNPRDTVGSQITTKETRYLKQLFRQLQ